MSTNPVDENIIFSWKLKEWFPDLEPNILTKFKQYADLIVKLNKTSSLIGPKTIPFIDSLHFADSILSYRVIHRENQSIDHLYDFGSGNGFPGIVYAILNPSLKLTLVDSDQKKIDSLKVIISALALNNVQTLVSSIEALPADSVKFAVSRGFANISKSILVARKCILKGGIYYHLKSEQWGLEVGEIPIQLCSIWNPALVSEYKIPNVPVKFAVIKTTKN